MSFFERLTGTINVDDEDQFDDIEEETSEEQFEREESGQLAVDVYETPEEIIIQTMVGGVRPEDLDISITREMCAISGHREGPHNVEPEDYFHQELYWGSFSREVVLPQEVEVEESQAVENHGLLIITLPKIDKDKSTKLKVESHE